MENFKTSLEQASITSTNEQLSVQLRGAIIKDATPADFQKVQVGIGAVSFKVGDIFKVIKPLLVDIVVAGKTRENIPAYVIQNAKGEERAVYANPLLRSTPTSDGPLNTYTAEVKAFNRGLLQDAPADFIMITEKLMGDGTQYVKIDDVIAYNTVARNKDKDGNPLPDVNPDGTANPNATFVIANKAYKLSHITAAAAKAAAKA